MRAGDRDADVRDRVWAAAEEHQVARQQRRARWEQRTGVALGLRGARDGDAGRLVGGVGEAAAVESAFGIAIAAPDVGLAELGLGECNGGQRGLAGRAAAGRGAAVMGGLGEHFVDVPVGVVVVPDGAAEVAAVAGAVVAQVVSFPTKINNLDGLTCGFACRTCS